MKSAKIAREFNVDGWLVSATSLSQGNVNDTYLVIFRTVFSEEKIVLQRINRNVFREPEKLMENMHTVTTYAHERLIAEHEKSDRIWQLPRVIPAKDGRDFVIDKDGEYWRAITRIASAHSYDSVRDADHAHEVGAVLGNFHHIISELPGERLHDTLPGFHITPRYLEQLDKVLENPEAHERLKSSQVAGNIMKFIDARRDFVSVLEDAKARGELSLRTIHGDPKTANIMIDDATMKGTAIIDLDTVKPGLVHYDFGDCLRSCCNPAGEECQDISKIYFDLDLCQALVHGYKEQAHGFMTDAERYYLYDSVRLITFELMMRFFSDYLAGDRYFKVRYDGQNLLRARVQMQLCRSIEARESQIRRTLAIL